MKKKINDSKKSKYIFVTLCIGCCALVILSLASDMSVGPLKYVSGYVITPIQKGLNEVGNWISVKEFISRVTWTMQLSAKNFRKR